MRFQVSTLMAMASAVVLFAGCGGAPEDEGRGISAVGNGSCAGLCGGQGDGCWCDAECDLYGDCCSDYEVACGAGCPEVLCTLYCEHGFRTGPDGCEICECNPPPPPPPEQCGDVLCPQGTECCNASCGICVPPGGACIQLACVPNACAVNGGECVPGDLADCGPNRHATADTCGGGVAATCCMPTTPPPPPADSCQGQCGGNANGCWCDEGCEAFGDCCADVNVWCADRQIASGYCVRNSGDACNSDADCVAGGCGGELCYNPGGDGGFSTCDCTQPTNVSGCGCVNGTCNWFN